jgi:RHS repeat-associated protein
VAIPPTSTTAQYNANNQVRDGSLGYDPAGNVTADNANSYLYDGEGRICAVYQIPIAGVGGLMTEYIYDAEGNRVAKGTITNWSAGCDPTQNGFTLTNTYVIGPSGEQLTETDGNGNWLHTNVFGAGKLLATYSYIDSSQTTTDTYFALSDWLGTKRAVVSAGGCGTGYASLPYGGDLTATGLSGFTQCPDATEHHFTGKERDTESGNDYFEARYYSSAMGRFMSPDWSAKVAPVPYAKLDDPQTLNLYNYMRNNPLGGTDPDGHCGDICSWLIMKVSTYVATHPEVDRALQKLGDSVGIKLSAGVGRTVDVGGVKLGAAASVTSDTRVDGTGSSKVQLTGAASVNGVGVQGNGTATFDKNGSLVNPLDNLSGNAKLTGSAPHGDNISSTNGAIGTDDRVGLGVGVNVGIAQAGVQVTAGTQEVQGVANAVVNSAVQDTRQYVQDLKETTTCGPGGCARPQ